ncbi:MAG: NAD(P)/FAD-dependent oxidoreductase [Planctomycetota bacterium]
MSSIQAKHLIVGGGLLGLSIADHLLRRGAEGVMVLEQRSSPASGRAGGIAPALATGQEAYHPLESRARLLLEEWESYLEIDPCYHRCGSVLVPCPDPLPPGGEHLDRDGVARRVPGLALADGCDAAFQGEDGLLDTTALLSALHWQVRKRGGNLFFHCQVQLLEEEEQGIAFSAPPRGGIAQRVYLAAGVDNLRLLRGLGADPPVAMIARHHFLFDAPAGGFSLVRLDGDEAVLLDSGEGQWLLQLAAEPDLHHREPVVDWRLLEEFRRQRRELLPGLGGARIRRGSAENLLALDPDPPGIHTAAAGRILAAGAFDLYGVLLALALGERMAEEGLADPR